MFITSEIHKLLLNYIDVSTKTQYYKLGVLKDYLVYYLLITCVDPFLNINNDHSNFLMNNEEIHFDHTIRN